MFWNMMLVTCSGTFRPNFSRRKVFSATKLDICESWITLSAPKVRRGTLQGFLTGPNWEGCTSAQHATKTEPMFHPIFGICIYVYSTSPQFMFGIPQRLKIFPKKMAPEKGVVEFAPGLHRAPLNASPRGLLLVRETQLHTSGLWHHCAQCPRGHRKLEGLRASFPSHCRDKKHNMSWIDGHDAPMQSWRPVPGSNTTKIHQEFRFWNPEKHRLRFRPSHHPTSRLERPASSRSTSACRLGPFGLGVKPWCWEATEFFARAPRSAISRACLKPLT